MRLDVDDAPVIEAQSEVLRGLSGFVGEKLSLLADINKAWQPSDFLPDLNREDWREAVQRMREPAQALSDEILVVLVADMITEEALPSYAISLNLLAQDYTGVSANPWAKWMRGWTAEENRHGDLLNAYLRLTGRVDMRSVEFTIHHLLNQGFNPNAYPELYGGLVYTSFQERATRISHNNVGKIAAFQGDKALAKISLRIAGDEARHESFYTSVMNRVMDQDPEGAMLTIRAMLRKTIAMPGRLMYDGHDPDLFDHFAIVAQRLGVYTAHDYASIIEHLVEMWDVAHRSVTGKAAKAQEYICRHGELCRELAGRMAETIAKQPKVPFQWIHGREA